MSEVQIAEAFVAAINSENLTQLRSLMSDDHTFTDAKGNSFSGADRMLVGWRGFLHAYPRYKILVDRRFTNGNEVALFGEATGSWRLNEIILPQTWKVTAAWLAQVEDQKIKHWTVFCDTAWISPPPQ